MISEGSSRTGGPCDNKRGYQVQDGLDYANQIFDSG